MHLNFFIRIRPFVIYNSVLSPEKYMTKVYRSKVDKWLLGILIAAMIVGIFGAVTAFAAAGWQAWWAIFPLLFGSGLPAWILTTTHYTLDDDTLVIRSGPFRWRVPVAEMRAVTETSNPLSSPALSLDRLRIEYENGRSVMISPEDKEGFLRDLRSRSSFRGNE